MIFYEPVEEFPFLEETLNKFSQKIEKDPEISRYDRSTLQALLRETIVKLIPLSDAKNISLDDQIKIIQAFRIELYKVRADEQDMLDVAKLSEGIKDKKQAYCGCSHDP